MAVTINAKGTSTTSFAIGKDGTTITQGGSITPPPASDLIINLDEDQNLVIDAGSSGPALITSSDDKDLHINPAVGGGQYLVLNANRWPTADGTTGQVLITNGSGVLTWSSVGSGTVTSVGVSGSDGISVSGSPITASGTISLSLTDIAPDSVVATNSITGSSIIPTGSSVPANGLYLPASNTVGLSTNSTERIRIDSAGRVGIGSSPSGWGSGYTVMNIQAGNLYSSNSTVATGLLSNYYYDGSDARYVKTGANSGIVFGGSGEIYLLTAPSGTGGAVQTLTTRLTVDVNGRVGIGSAPSSDLLYVKNPSAGTTATIESGSTSGSATLNIVVPSTASPISAQLVFREDSTSKWALGYKNIGAGGTQDFSLYGYAASANAFVVDPNNYLMVGYTSSNGAYRLQVNSQIFATSSTIATSDGRYKDNVADLVDALDKVNALRPVQFDWKPHEVHNFPEGKTVGFIAQEVEEALEGEDYLGSIIKTNTVTLPDDTQEEFKGIAEGNLIALLVGAVKELTDRVAQLQARIDILEG